MANQTVSTDLNYDSSAISGLANGDNITINSGAKLTVNSDMRWGQQSAVVGDIDITEGELKIDATETWWIPFDTSSGNVPALGTVGTPDVTRGGSNVGEFLGVFTALGVAPSTAGSSMPASGFIKLRTKSVTLADDDVLTFTGGATITINSTTGGQRGWLHIVGEEGTTSLTGRVHASSLLSKITTNGGWFELGVSNGVAGQVFQHFVGDYCPALQVETGNGTGIYQWWGACAVADFSDVNVPTDARGRWYSCTSAGVITFGGDTYGVLPPSGARIRVPNIHISTSTSADWSANVVNAVTPIYRYRLFGSPGALDINYVISCGNIIGQTTQSYSVKTSAGLDGCFYGNAGTPSTYHSNVVFENVSTSFVLTPGRIQLGFAFSENLSFTDVNVFRMPSYDSASSPMSFSACNNVTFTRLELFGRQQGGSCLLVTSSSNVVFDNCVIVTPAVYAVTLTSSINVIMRNSQFCGRMVGATGAPNYEIYANDINGLIIDGLTMFSGINLGPSNQFIYSSGGRNIRVRNIGTRDVAPVVIDLARELVSLVNVRNARLERVFYRPRAGYDINLLVQNATDDVIQSDCGWSYTAGAFAQAITDVNRSKRIIGGGLKTYATAPIAGRTCSVFNARGMHFVEQEVSATEIMLTVMTGSPKTTSDFSSPAYTEDAGTILRDGNNGLALRNIGDQVTWTWGWYILGVNSLQNTAPLLDGVNTGNFTLTYDIDKGNGFSGSFKALTASNWSAETGISPSIGFRWKLRAVCNTANTSNLLRAVSMFCDTTQQTLTDNPYPYNEPKVALSNTQAGSLGAVFQNSNGKLLDVKSATTPNLYPAWYSDASCTVRVRKAGWNEVETPFTLTEDGASFPLNQTNSAIPDTDPGALGITVTNHGASPVTWEGKEYSITITVSDSSTAAQIAQYISWHTAQDAYSLVTGYHNMALPAMVVAVGAEVETSRGTLFGSAGASLKGVRVVDGSDNAIAGFARFQSDDGTYYTTPQIATISHATLLAGSRVQLFNVTTDTEIENVVLAGVGYEYSYTGGVGISEGDTIRLRATKVGYLGLELNSAAGVQGSSFVDTQVVDTVYVSNGIDGSAITEFTASYNDVQIELDDPDGITTVQRMYAWYHFNLTTELGIRHYFGTCVAEDLVNYRIVTTVMTLNLDNVTANPVRLVGARIYRDDGGALIAPSSGSIQIEPDKVYAIETGVSGLTPQESAELFKLTPIKKNVDLIPALL